MSTPSLLRIPSWTRSRTSRCPTPSTRCANRSSRWRKAEIRISQDISDDAEEMTMADAAHAKPHHDYHLVNPSPWPAVGATSAFVSAVGLILWMHHIVAYAPIILGAGMIGIAYTMIGWWRDVIHEAEFEGDHTPVGQILHRYGMILFIASEGMFFVAWFWA